MTQMPKLLLALPTTDSCHIFYTLALLSMCAVTKTQFTICAGRSSNVCQSRNVLVDTAQKTGAEFMLFIDNDMSFPPITADRLVKIAEMHSLDILGCNYLFKTPPHKPMAGSKDRQAQDLQGIDEVDYLPAGMLLIRTSVFDKLEKPYFLYDPTPDRSTAGTEDFYFCDRARSAGFRIWMDSWLSLSLVHWTGSFGIQWTIEPPGFRYVFDSVPFEGPVANG